jgi:DNA repair exonuclease SbcCD nuclease subunit
VREIARLAQERNVDVVVVAGDVFDDNAVGADTLQQAHDVLTGFGQVPVVLLPGNHDPATADSALERLQPPKPVIVATARESITLKEATVYPCPLTRRHEHEDPTEWLPSRTSDEGIRIALAHGCALDFSEETETPNRIDVAAVLGKGFDYLAMGDWHGSFRLDDRAWYSGTPEATRFREREPGRVLVVDIEAPGANRARSEVWSVLDSITTEPDKQRAPPSGPSELGP